MHSTSPGPTDGSVSSTRLHHRLRCRPAPVSAMMVPIFSGGIALSPRPNARDRGNSRLHPRVRRRRFPTRRGIFYPFIKTERQSHRQRTAARAPLSASTPPPSPPAPFVLHGSLSYVLQTTTPNRRTSIACLRRLDYPASAPNTPTGKTPAA